MQSTLQNLLLRKAQQPCLFRFPLEDSSMNYLMRWRRRLVFCFTRMRGRRLLRRWGISTTSLVSARGERLDLLNASRQVLRGNDTIGKSVQKIEEKEGNCDSPNDIPRVGCSNACRPP